MEGRWELTKASSEELIQKCEAILLRIWQEITETEGETEDFLRDKALSDIISKCLNSPTKSYRYVLPTQLLAKVADHSLDCQCIQVSRGAGGDFDARSVCHKVVVPFDKKNNNVLGGSPEPYVNNPLRVPEISEKYRYQQKDKGGWDNLCLVLKEVEERDDPAFSELVLKQVMLEVFRRLADVRVEYPVPKRISLENTLSLIEEYVSAKSGGIRLQNLTYALLLTVGKRFNLFGEINCQNVNAADASTGQLADIECLDAEGNLILVVEVKDRKITPDHIREKLPGLRSRGISEFLYITLARQFAAESLKEILDTITKEFSSGQNIYLFDFVDFARGILALLGEKGRREFLVNVGVTLDRYSAPVVYRKDWAALLSKF